MKGLTASLSVRQSVDCCIMLKKALPLIVSRVSSLNVEDELLPREKGLSDESLEAILGGCKSAPLSHIIIQVLASNPLEGDALFPLDETIRHSNLKLLSHDNTFFTRFKILPRIFK